MNAHSPRDLAILLNENAKRVSKRLRDSFERLAPRVPMYSSRTIDEARAQIREALDRGCKRIVCGGGDGTLVHALNHIREYVNEQNARFQEFSAEMRGKFEQVRWPQIGILKLGTGNGWAHEVGSRKPAATLLRLRDEQDGPSTKARNREERRRRALESWSAVDYVFLIGGGALTSIGSLLLFGFTVGALFDSTITTKQLAGITMMGAPPLVVGLILYARGLRRRMERIDAQRRTAS